MREVWGVRSEGSVEVLEQREVGRHQYCGKISSTQERCGGCVRWEVVGVSGGR